MQIPAMFDNSEYQSLIDKINKIRSYGLNKMLTIPQIAILGDQSSGKSSVLEAITKLSFPRNIETCTKFATQVSMRRSDRVEMSARIDGEPEFNTKYEAQGAEWDVQTIVEDANRILCEEVDISEKVLEITISGPTLSPLTIIDLPGYINTTVDGQDKSIVETIRSINTRYIRDSRTIILAVVPANVDLNSILILGEAERYDPEHERTIPIVTKPDTIEPDLLPNLVQTLNNKRKKMKLGYLVMKNSSFKDIGLTWDEARQREADFFRSSDLWAQVPDSVKGRVSVKKFLGTLLYTHIKKELPSLKKEILNLISECSREIDSMGPPVMDAQAAKMTYSTCIRSLEKSLTALLSGQYSYEYISQYKDTDNSDGDDEPSGDDDDDEPKPVDGEQRFIYAKLARLYGHYDQVMRKDKHLMPKDKMSRLVRRYKGPELPAFVSFRTFTQIYMETLVRWRNLTTAHVTNMHTFLHDAVSTYIDSVADPLLKDLFQLEFDKFYNSQVAKVDDTLKNIFIDEESPFTLNKYYFDNILKSRHANAEKMITGAIQKYQANHTHNGIAAALKAAKEDATYNDELEVEDLQEKLLSYCKVARKRIADVVPLQTIERYLIKQISLYFDMLAAVDDGTISTLLLDSPANMARRQELNDKVVVLRKSLLEL
ncbi:hypothetical protein BGX28_010097 [Mortierella sp. GBA30]|nr:hypothetical protein BGX28_010097 [Mortierella sp. GBA30]